MCLTPRSTGSFRQLSPSPSSLACSAHQLGYDGVVCSDDLEMKAISASYSVEEATLRALQAGVDILLYCHEVDTAAASV